MTTIDQILGKCVVRVQSDYKEQNEPVNCRGCSGYRTDAERRDCEVYKPYILRNALKTLYRQGELRYE